MKCPNCGTNVREFVSSLRKERTRRGLTVAEAAAQVGVSVATWYKWEEGSHDPRPLHKPLLENWLKASEDEE